MEEQIKRRVAIGSFVSERKLVDELVRCAPPPALPQQPAHASPILSCEQPARC